MLVIIKIAINSLRICFRETERVNEPVEETGRENVTEQKELEKTNPST